MSFDEIYKRLSLIGKDGFISLSSPDWNTRIHLPERIMRLITDNNSPLSQLSALFCFGGKPLLFFFENPKDETSLHKAIWNLNEIPVVVVGKSEIVEVYNGFAYEKELGQLRFLGGENVLDDFTYFKIVTGQGWEEYRDRLAYHNRVDYFLLKNIQYAQEKILKTSVKRNLANRLIGKIIFLRYLADRKIMLLFEGERRILTNEDIIALLQNKARLAKLFDALQDRHTGFNGDLFKITYEELSTVPNEALNVLVRLLRSEDLESGEYSLFDVYDFSILPVEFISNVYERFIGKENQEKKGAYYTPLFLVDYIVEKTVAEHLKHIRDSSCKVLDPACGSGIFLVESLRRIIEHFRTYASAEDLVGERFQDKLKELAVENIYGIDSDLSAVQVAAFSIYLTLLDYLKPADASSFRFPNLLERNLICRDTFEKSPLEGMNFDFIIGNPPWKRGSKEVDENGEEAKPEFQKFIKIKENQEGRTIVNNNEIAQAFVVRTFDFMQSNTQCALVLTSKVLYNIQSKGFRSYLLNKAQVDSVLELSAVRHEVFNKSSDPSVAPACVMMYRVMPEGENADDHIIAHMALKPSVFFSLFKVLTAEKADIQYIRQGLLLENDYLWKILMYGSYLDFLFIKRLRKKYTILSEINKLGFIQGQGVICGKESNRKYDACGLLGKTKIDAKQIQQYYVTASTDFWDVTRVQRKRRPELFMAPLLLIRKSTDANDYTARSAIYTGNAVYTDAITGIHGDQIDVLRNIAGVLNSSLFPYFALMCMSSIGTEREQSHNKEKFGMPYVDGGICKHVKRIETSYRLYNEDPLINRGELVKIAREKKAIEKCIANELCITDVEKALIAYANEYSIPLSTGKHKGSLLRNNKSGRSIIAHYAKVFENRFNCQFGKGLFVNYRCYITSSHVMIRFVVEDEKKVPVFGNSTPGALESFLIALSCTNISDNLYLRKDIRGFEKDGFYIIKPSEVRLWHQAIAYMDVQEVADAIMEQGMKEGER